MCDLERASSTLCVSPVSAADNYTAYLIIIIIILFAISITINMLLLP